MARMTLNVPDHLARAFDEVLKGQDKSDVMAALMREAIERVERKGRSQASTANNVSARRGKRLRKPLSNVTR
jgi:metal-responsive CopG/Arc/MetJ family transcriptional regulator